MSSRKSSSTGYSLLHLLVAVGLAQAVALSCFLVIAALIDPGMKFSVVAPSAQILAIVIVFFFYLVPLVPEKKAPLAALRRLDKQMMSFAVIGFVGSLIAPVAFPVASLPVGSPCNTAISVLSLSAVLLFPLSIGVQSLLVLLARHVRPVTIEDEE